MRKLLAGLVTGMMMLVMNAVVALAAPIIWSGNGHGYELVTANDWNTAEANAIANGGHLVTVNDSAEQVWLNQTFSQSDLWIGFNDIANEGNWVWTSGESVTYTNWANGEPNNNGNEDVAVMNWNGSQWNDLPASGWTIQGIAEIPTPEPATMLLLGTGLAALAGARKLKKQLPA
jgi:hypothetical protein